MEKVRLKVYVSRAFNFTGLWQVPIFFIMLQENAFHVDHNFLDENKGNTVLTKTLKQRKTAIC